MIETGSDLDAALRSLRGPAPAGDATRPAALHRLESEIDRASPKRARRRWRRGWLIGAVAIGLAAPAALAASGQLDGDAPTVYRSDTDPPVYSLSPITSEHARAVAAAIERNHNSGEGDITTGEIDYCLKAEELGRTDPFCAMTLTAYRDGNLPTVPGPDPGTHEIMCTEGIELLPGEHCTRASANVLDSAP